jgi:hypothetical protein
MSFRLVSGTTLGSLGEERDFGIGKKPSARVWKLLNLRRCEEAGV